MTITRKLLLLIACSNLLLCADRAFAQGALTAAQETLDIDLNNARPVQNVLTAEWGHGAARNTYLAPLLYEGNQWGVRFERWRTMRSGKWHNQQIIDADFLMGEAELGKMSEMWNGRAVYRYAMHRGIYGSTELRSDGVKGQGLRVYAGPYAGAELGFDYNLKIGAANNPGAARAVTNVGVSAMAVYDYRIKGRPCSVQLQAQAPLLGVAFMPEFGASYYETFLIGSDNNTHFASLHNEQDLDVRLSTDIPLAVIPGLRRMKTVLRLGGYYHIETMKINQIVNRYSTIGICVGWTWKYLPL